MPFYVHIQVILQLVFFNRLELNLEMCFPDKPLWLLFLWKISPPMPTIKYVYHYEEINFTIVIQYAICILGTLCDFGFIASSFHFVRYTFEIVPNSTARLDRNQN